MKARTDTTRLYRFESTFLHKRGQPGNKDTSIGALRVLAAKVWKDAGRQSHDVPPIIAGKGVKYNDAMYSYYEVKPVHKIVLVRNQRRPTLLLHEMTHALGYGNHDSKFCKTYFKLLHKYLGYDLDELKLQAASFNITMRT